MPGDVEEKMDDELFGPRLAVGGREEEYEIWPNTKIAESIAD